MIDIQQVGLSPHYVPYLDGWAHQRRIHADVVAGARVDTLLLLEHEAVYTAGKRTEAHERPDDGTPVIDVDRGGKITWHGRASSSGIRSCGSPNPSTSSRTSAASKPCSSTLSVPSASTASASKDAAACGCGVPSASTKSRRSGSASKKE